MIVAVEHSDGQDWLVTPSGRLAVAPGLYRRRTCSAETFGDAVSAAHQSAWEAGDCSFVYTEKMAKADGVA